MKDFVVAHIDWYNHELTLELVHATNWKDAISKHSKTVFGTDCPVPDTIEDMKQFCFDSDCMMDFIEL